MITINTHKIETNDLQLVMHASLLAQFVGNPMMTDMLNCVVLVDATLKDLRDVEASEDDPPTPVIDALIGILEDAQSNNVAQVEFCYIGDSSDETANEGEALPFSWSE